MTALSIALGGLLALGVGVGLRCFTASTDDDVFLDTDWWQA